MKVLMVTPFYFPIIGGTESFIESLSLKLSQLGVHTDVLTFNFKRKASQINEEVIPILASEVQKINGIKVIRIPCFRGTRAFKLLRMELIPASFLNCFKEYDLIHFHNESSLTLPILTRHFKKPKLMHCHCLDVSYSYYRKNIITRTALLHIADIYITVSKYISQLLLNLGVPVSKIRVVYNAVDTELFKPSRGIKAKNMLLFVGRLQPKKGLHILLKSLRYISKPINLVIIGPLSKYTPQYTTEVFSLVESINKKTAHNVVYLGVRKKEELIKWYQKATIFVCPSLSEPFGIVNLEALSCKTPVIASKVGGIPEVIQNNRNGLLVQPGDPKQLAEAIQFLLDDEKLREKYGEEGRKIVLQHFSQEVIAKKILEIYNELLVKFK
jgi:glycosyltransferase involved in cell wall biosynthesis